MSAQRGDFSGGPAAQRPARIRARRGRGRSDFAPTGTGSPRPRITLTGPRPHFRQRDGTERAAPGNPTGAATKARTPGAPAGQPRTGPWSRA